MIDARSRSAKGSTSFPCSNKFNDVVTDVITMLVLNDCPSELHRDGGRRSHRRRDRCRRCRDHDLEWARRKQVKRATVGEAVRGPPQSPNAT